MAPDCVNLPCEQNKSPSKAERRFETERSPADRHTGNQRHFFTKLLTP
jgi:hypothetical protein